MALYYDEILAGNCFGQINVMPSAPKSHNTNLIETKSSPSGLSTQFGIATEDLFHLGRKFLNEKKEEIQFKYGDNINLIALSKQAKLGKWNPSYTQNIGFLDVVGNDRKQAWIRLGDMTKEQAMEAYVKLLLDRCPIFRSYLESQHVGNVAQNQMKKDYENRQRLEEEAEQVRKFELEQILRLEKQKKKREDLQRKQIQEALNQQTYSQFKAYAEQHHRNNIPAQEELIRQLQEQHFQKYLQQISQQQIRDQQLRSKVNMEQQSENMPPQTTIPSMQANTVIPPPVANVVPPNIVTMPLPTNDVQSSTNTEFSTAQIPSIGSPSIQLPPLGPAPTQLPPLVHPPPPQLMTTPNATNNEVKSEPVMPVQAQFETLNLDSPLEYIPPVGPQQTINNEIPQQLPPSVEITDEVHTSNETMGNSVILPSATDPDAAAAAAVANGEQMMIPGQENQDLPTIVPPNMWTRKDIKEFKDQIRKEKEAVIKVGSGETVTVRVPTHQDGQCVFWEFATDYYDLGFGVYFEWVKVESNSVTIHVSDSSDEEEEPEDGEKKDIEKGSGSTNKPPKPRQTEIVPIYRRDCHEEVYAGSHTYPGQGVYLLKFDNSYSLWRSKTLYYRVYYSK